MLDGIGISGLMDQKNTILLIRISSVRLKVEQHQLVVGGGWNSLVSVGLEGACYLGLLENRHR